MKKEEWRTVANFEGVYEVSNLGKIKRVKKAQGTAGAVLKQSTCKKGYKWVGLSKDGQPKNYPVHRLVAIAFHENKSNKCCVNHIDSNRGNNESTNLEWVTPKENTQHCIKSRRFNSSAHGLKGEKNPRAKLTALQVLEIRRSQCSLRELVEIYSLSYKYLSKLRGGKAWKHI